jgi:DNA polymerase III subunit beta
MDIRIDKNKLLRGLYLAHGIADRKSTMPILANVLIRSEGVDRISCASTDLKVAMVVTLPAKVELEGGVTVAARQAFEIAKGLSGEEVHLRRTENNWLEIQSGRANFKVVGMSDREFPKLPSVADAELCLVDPKVLLEMIGKTLFSISQDDTRPHLASVLFESDGEVARMVSTDGHRLSKAGKAMVNGPKLATGVLIPRKGVGEIRRTIEGREAPCEIGVHQGFFVLRADDVTLTVKLGEGQFPPYDQVIPKENDKIILLEREVLLDALRRVSIIASDKTWGIRLSLEKNALSIEADNPDLGNARETLDVDYKGSGLQIGFNARYFIDILTEMTSKNVRLELGEDLDPAVVRPADDSDYLGVVMPMRL